MKKAFLLLFTVFATVVSTSAQTNYGNEWIDYTQPHYKIKVVNQSLYRIPYSVLEANGLPMNGSQLKMFCMGQEVPLYVSNSGEMGPNDYVEFYGVPNDGSYDTRLFDKQKWQLNPYQSLFCDTAIYFLTASGTGVANLRYQNNANDLSGPLPPKEEYFWHTSLKWFKNIFTGGEPFRNLGGVNNYHADFGNGEGFTGLQFIEGETKLYKLNTDHVYTGNAALTAHLETKVIGQSDDLTNIPDHHLLIEVSGNLYVDTVYEGYENYTYHVNLPLSQLADPLTDVEYTGVADLSNADKNSVVYANITYPHTFDFNNTRKFLFTIANNANKYLEITNFNGGTAPVLYDLTNRLRFTPVIEGGTYKFYLPAIAGGPATRKLFFSNTTTVCDINCVLPGCNPANCGIFTVSAVEQVAFANYSQTGMQGNYLIISHPALMQGDINEVERYRLYRSSPEGGNYEAIVVDINQLYDQFAYGIQKNPLAIRNFVNFAEDTWSVAPQYLLLLGKSIGYHRFGLNPAWFNLCLVPSYGHQPSDLMLSVRDTVGYENQLATGRVPAKTPAEVAAYLNKLIQYETPSPCTKEDRLWRKTAINIAGGTNLSEANSFLSYLNKYKAIYEDTLMGGNVAYTYAKAADLSVIVEFPDIDEEINNGLSMITFLGHSSGQYWNVDLGPPTDYNNVGKYPFMISSSCFVGNIHDPVNPTTGVTMAEDYVLTDQLGAIGFLATVSFGFPSYMDIVVDRLYRNFCLQYYGQPIGYNIKKAVQTISAAYPTSDAVKMTVQEYTLAGDPAVVIQSWNKPEYIVEEADVYFEPAEITANLDSFAVNVVVTNLGKAVKDSLSIEVNRTYPDGTTEMAALKRFAAPVFIDTLTLYVQTSNDTTEVTGENIFTVNVDYGNEIDEDCENNNSVNKSAFIFSDLLVPISPCNFTIVCNPSPTLYASTGQPLLAPLPYKMEIDTTTLFNNPLSQIVLNSESGVIKWQPGIPLQDNRVYYWRASQLSPNGDAYNWQMNSFIYRADSCQSGWNQSHYYQFLKDKFYQTQIDPVSRQFEFTGINNIISAKNARDSYFDIEMTLNYTTTLVLQSCLKGSCDGGLSFIVFKPELLLEPMTTTRQNDQSNCNGVGSYGNIQCSPGVRYGFEFYTNSTDQLDTMLYFLQNVIPDGYYVLAYSVRNHRMGSTNPADVIYPYQDALYNFFTQMGTPQVADLSGDQPFIAFGKKGAGTAFPGVFVTPDNPADVFETEIAVAGKHPAGTLTSTTIGPSTQWGSLDWKQHPLDNPETSADSISINIYGLPANGAQPVLLLNSGNNYNFDLSSIDATQYPFLKLECTAADSVAFTMPQLDYWRVYYQLAGELALDQKEHFVFLSDTLDEGEHVHFEMAVTNASGTNMDSVLVAYTIVDNNNQAHIINSRQAPIAAHQTGIITFDYSTEGLGGNNILIVELNPNDDQPEKFRFNNVLILSFFVNSDKVNPVLDVTFDGRHILDGELVSAKPFITIKTKDENRYLALNDTSDFKLYIKYPDITTGEPAFEVPVYFANPMVQFIPATAAQAANGNNAATIELKPEFEQSGLYELIVRARDRSSNNFAADKAYKTTFKVETKPMVSNVFNYPNPFTSSTRFVFTITGSQVPDFMKIQIMTISGRVVREITKDELGPIRIGNNLTEFAWDGTDQFGNTLANGLYLYRVVTRLNDENMDHFKLGDPDDLFKNGIGKMYLMR
ncbi:hypothetical protein C7N43_13420 [Sphingobacteriales bacterium UPWRP_1]|nr:hypothetical protein B6N25_03555 [Sphingobacteriales bacterium TSM_CSS]PSJ76525.1 hypothetical protein C7N43_13420 [Sphingobacteriales bacterium UPWRP_1]